MEALLILAALLIAVGVGLAGGIGVGWIAHARHEADRMDLALRIQDTGRSARAAAYDEHTWREAAWLLDVPNEYERT